MDLKRELLRSSTQVVLAAVAGAALQPIITRPEVVAVGEQFAQGVIIVAGTSAVVLIAGRAAYQLQRWSRTLPPAHPMQGRVFAFEAASPAMPRTAAQEFERLLWERQQAQEARERDAELRVALATYSFFGSNIANGARFSWRWMCRYMGRADWTRCMNTMLELGVLVPARGNEPPTWADGWRHSRFRIELQHTNRWPDIPYPREAPLPEFRRGY